MTIYEEIISGLSRKQKVLPSKLFYDERGSKLFDEICELEEYYPTRTELKILEDNIHEIVGVIPDNTILMEFGSGSSIKTRILLENIEKLDAYVPIDISEEHLLKTGRELSKDFPNHKIIPIVADYTKPLIFPEEIQNVEHKIVYFPGSTIGNFNKDNAVKFLEIVADECGEEGGLIIGIDLIKDIDVITRAYNDSKGVTAEFNLNILYHLNSVYEFDFDVQEFDHNAFYNESDNRIEMHLVSNKDQEINSGKNHFFISKNETILTEYSHKYSIGSFTELCDNNFELQKVWTDSQKYFGILYLSVL